jgi:hypothetical protein
VYLINSVQDRNEIKKEVMELLQILEKKGCLFLNWDPALLRNEEMQ